METQKSTEIIINKFNGRIPLKKDLLDILQNENLVFILRRKNEIHIMKEEKYLEILNRMKEKSWFTPSQLKHSKKGEEFIREICSDVSALYIKNTFLSLYKTDIMKKRLQGKRLKISINL